MFYGVGAPQVSYTTNEKGYGPSWGFSLFEDNAEYGFGMYLGVKKMRSATKNLATEAVKEGVDLELEEALKQWLEDFGV